MQTNVRLSVSRPFPRKTQRCGSGEASNNKRRQLAPILDAEIGNPVLSSPPPRYCCIIHTGAVIRQPSKKVTPRKKQVKMLFYAPLANMHQVKVWRLFSILHLSCEARFITSKQDAHLIVLLTPPVVAFPAPPIRIYLVHSKQHCCCCAHMLSVQENRWSWWEPNWAFPWSRKAVTFWTGTKQNATNLDEPMGIIVVRSDQTNIDRIYLNDEFSSAQFSHDELTAVVQFVHRRCSSVIAKTRKRGRSSVNQLPAYISRHEERWHLRRQSRWNRPQRCLLLATCCCVVVVVYY